MKYKSKKNLLELLKVSPYIERESIYQVGGSPLNLNLPKTTVDTYISRFLDANEMIRFKRGLYVTTDFYNEYKNDSTYLFFLANILRKPSYISSWTALQYYNLATEVVYPVMSVSPKATRRYDTKLGAFFYQTIKSELFTDFVLVSDTFSFFIASPAKALFDMLYFKTRQFRDVELNDIDRLLEELRIDMTEMDDENKQKFYAMVHKAYEK